MTPVETAAMYAATCRCCLLAASMRDCANCVFNVLEPARPMFILSRSWADQHLNSDDDLKYFPGKAVIR